MPWSCCFYRGTSFLAGALSCQHLMKMNAILFLMIQSSDFIDNTFISSTLPNVNAQLSFNIHLLPLSDQRQILPDALPDATSGRVACTQFTAGIEVI